MKTRPFIATSSHRRSRGQSAAHSGRRILAVSAASLLALVAGASTASAGAPIAPASFWLGGTDGTWTGANWASNSAGTPTPAIPLATSDITFSATGAANQTTTLGADFTIHSLTISDPVPVTINSGATTRMLTLSGPAIGTAASGLNVKLGAGLVTVGADVTLGAAANAITVNNAAGAVINGALSSSNGLVKEGTGILTLAGPNFYTGPTTVSFGTLRAGGSNLGGIGTSGPGAFGDNSAVFIGSNGKLDLGGYSVGIGSLEGNSGAIVQNSGSAAATLTTGGDNRSTPYLGVIQDGTGALSLVKIGTGVLTLGGANTYTGTTTVNGGILVVDNDGAGRLGSLGTGATTVNGDNGPSISHGTLTFLNLASAGSGTFTTNAAGGLNSITADPIGGTTNFFGHSTAGSATFTTNGVTAPGITTPLSGGSTNFYDETSAGSATFTTNGGALPFAAGGATNFLNNATAANATFTTNGGTFADARGGTTSFSSQASAGNGQFTVNGGTNGGDGGILIFADLSTATNAKVQLNGNGKLDISGHAAPGVAIGSLAATSGTVFLGANRLDIGGDNSSTSIGSTIQDGGLSGGAGGSLKKSGTGTQILFGTNSYTGGTTFGSGTLIAGNVKAFGSGNLTMTGGTLKTTGGPLAVDIGAGNILFSGGTYVANVGGTTPGVTHDQLKTTGSANIAAGKLALVQLNNFQLKLGDKVVLLSALAGVAGGTATGTPLPGANVTGLAAFSNSALLIPVINLYGTSVVLEAIQGPFSGLPPTLGLTPTQTAIAGTLDGLAPNISTNPELGKVFAYLDSLALSDLPGALEMLSPAALTSILELSKSLANIQTSNVLQRLADIRSAELSGTGSAGSPGSGAHGPSGRPSKAVAPAPEERWGLWMTGNGEFVHIGNTAVAAGFDLDSGGVTAGVDYRFTDHFAAGISLGYMNTRASIANGGKVDVDGGRVGAYATYFKGGLHLDAAVSGGPNGYSTRRTTPGNTTATASPDGTEVNLLFAGGYDWKWNAVTLGPIASFQYTNVQLDGFTERGNFAPLRIETKNAESLRSAVGFHASIDKRVGRAIVRPEVRASWQHEFGDVNHSLTASFATFGGAPFTVFGPGTGRDSMLLTAGCSVQWTPRFATYAYYDAEFFRTNYSSHNVSVGFRYQF